MSVVKHGVGLPREAVEPLLEIFKTQQTSSAQPDLIWKLTLL